VLVHGAAPSPAPRRAAASADAGDELWARTRAGLAPLKTRR
jgi:hypothetical protein